jgi:hypothetical protein
MLTCHFISSLIDAPLDYLKVKVVDEHVDHGFCDAWKEKFKTRWDLVIYLGERALAIIGMIIMH